MYKLDSINIIILYLTKHLCYNIFKIIKIYTYEKVDVYNFTKIYGNAYHYAGSWNQLNLRIKNNIERCIYITRICIYINGCI